MTMVANPVASPRSVTTADIETSVTTATGEISVFEAEEPTARQSNTNITDQHSPPTVNCPNEEEDDDEEEDEEEVTNASASCSSCRQLHSDIQISVIRIAEKLDRLALRVEELFAFQQQHQQKNDGVTKNNNNLLLNDNNGNFDKNTSKNLFDNRHASILDLAAVAAATTNQRSLALNNNGATISPNSRAKKLSKHKDILPRKSSSPETLKFNGFASLKTSRAGEELGSNSPSPISPASLPVSDCATDFDIYSNANNSSCTTMLSGSKKRKPMRDTVHKVSNASIGGLSQKLSQNNNNNRMSEEMDCKDATETTVTSTSTPSPRTSPPLPAAMVAANVLKGLNNGSSKNLEQQEQLASVNNNRVLEPLFANLFSNNLYSALLQHQQTQQQQQVLLNNINIMNNNNNCNGNASATATSIGNLCSAKLGNTPAVSSPSSSTANGFFGDEFGKEEGEYYEDEFAASGVNGDNSTISRCNNCNTTKTTAWRRDQTGKLVCNACGLYFRLHRTKRPVHMRKDFIQQRFRRKNAAAKDDDVIINQQSNNNNKSPSPILNGNLCGGKNGGADFLINPATANLPSAAATANVASNMAAIQSLSSLINANSHLFGADVGYLGLRSAKNETFN